MIEDFEIVKIKQQEANCTRCRKKIEVGDIRGVETYYFKSHPSRNYYCLSCSGNQLRKLNNKKEEIIKKYIYEKK
jgi:hypothetical protein